MAFSLSGSTVIIDGNETSDSLLAWLPANAPTWQVQNRSIIAGGYLQINDGAIFTSTNTSYIFPSTYRFTSNNTADTNQSELSFTDCVIIYTGSAKSHTNQIHGRKITMRNVQFRVEVPLALRTDFFNPWKHDFVLENVQFIYYSSGGTLHLGTQGGELKGISVFNKGGILGVQPDTVKGTVIKFYDLTLSGVSGMIGNGPNGSKDLTAVTEFWRLNWDNPTWFIGSGNRGQYYKIINPVKPEGWVGYRGQYRAGYDATEEFMTHDVTIVDEGNNAIEGSNLILWRDADEDIQYDLSSDANGAIPQQIVKTVQHNATDNFTYFDGWTLGVYHYLYEIKGGARLLNEGQIAETVLTPTDSNITCTNPSEIENYAYENSAQKIYDAAKRWKLTHREIGDKLALPIARNGRVIESDYPIDIVSSGAVFDFDGAKITIAAEALNCDFVLSSGVVTIGAGVAHSGSIIDANGDSFVNEKNGYAFAIYASDADRNARENALGSNITNFRFSFSSAVTYFLWVNLDGVDLPAQITVSQGANVLDLGIAGAITALGAKTDEAIFHAKRANMQTQGG